MQIDPIYELLRMEMNGDKMRQTNYNMTLGQQGRKRFQIIEYLI